MIKVICVGKLKENYLGEMVSDYLKRINKYHKTIIEEIKDSNIDTESELILKHISDNSYSILLDIKGTNLDSISLAKLIEKTFITNSNIVFIIGGSNGVNDSVKSRANYVLSFGKNTYPHGLFRAILLEQIYRAFKINNNERYHK